MRLSTEHLYAVVVVKAGVVLLVVCVLAFRPSPDDAAPAQPEAPTVKQVTDPSTEALARMLDSKPSTEERVRAFGDLKCELTQAEIDPALLERPVSDPERRVSSVARHDLACFYVL